MLDFMENVQNAFSEASHWNPDNSYGALNATARALLNFEIPRGLRLQISSLAAPNFATSYTLGSVGVVDGSVSYLYSSLPLKKDFKSSNIDLHHVIRGYRHLRELRGPDEKWWWELWHAGKRIDRRNTLLYGRIFLPQSRLEALYLRRLTPTRQLRIAAVSDSSLNNGGTILTLLQNDVGKYSTEYMYSTDSALLGVRGLYNFGPEPRTAPTTEHTDPLHGRFSAGAELYYGLLNKSGGISTGLRFTTLPNHPGFPYTMTLTLNPLMGNLSSSYAVKAGPNLALCSRFDFNFYSYESELQLGCELWRRRSNTDVEWAVKKLRPDWVRPTASPDDDVTGVLKAKVDQDWRIGVLWEGRIKELLFTLGASLDLKKREQIIRSVGIELQYSS
ncbi:mitochondrial distribution and morphology protein 10 [Dothidotthia symphoricarpi CBS 119687]|uniref:Mitochondrial distribution and morphology protein 10 n=1 Tax=Dothidotthia symphoricarpi CBS 119687 TaxID=1392245 RepID=A0A6A6A2V7_9PLEO|nr:mitochondrial distribution and morphology protein 10 [Dothidotthia symphoricarpi CBS 119687]KAF2126342.1 mitochondrial distribution and morphology protein 10 [Dothidotthia symphoricarpi CBS 119687]